MRFGHRVEIQRLCAHQEHHTQQQRCDAWRHATALHASRSSDAVASGNNVTQYHNIGGRLAKRKIAACRAADYSVQHPFAHRFQIVHQ